MVRGGGQEAIPETLCWQQVSGRSVEGPSQGRGPSPCKRDRVGREGGHWAAGQQKLSEGWAVPVAVCARRAQAAHAGQVLVAKRAASTLPWPQDFLQGPCPFPPGSESFRLPPLPAALSEAGCWLCLGTGSLGGLGGRGEAARTCLLGQSRSWSWSKGLAG